MKGPKPPAPRNNLDDVPELKQSVPQDQKLKNVKENKSGKDPLVIDFFFFVGNNLDSNKGLNK